MAEKLQTIQKRRSIPLLIIGVLVLGGLIWFFSDTSRRALLSKGNAVLYLEVSGPALEEGWVWPQDGTAYVTAYDKETNEREVLPFSLSTPAGKRVLIYGAVPPSCRIDERSLVFYGMEMADDANPPVFRLVGTVTNPGKSTMPLIGKVVQDACSRRLGAGEDIVSPPGIGHPSGHGCTGRHRPQRKLCDVTRQCAPDERHCGQALAGKIRKCADGRPPGSVVPPAGRHHSRLHLADSDG